MLEALLTELGLDPARGVYVFLLLTLAIGGGAAWRTGEAVARGWHPVWPLVPLTALLAAAIRFLNFALFDGILLALPGYILDTAVLLIFALLGYRMRRTRQMTEQYAWTFSRASPLSWHRR